MLLMHFQYFSLLIFSFHIFRFSLFHSFPLYVRRLKAEQFFQFFFIYLCSDHTNTSRVFRRSGTHFIFSRNHVKVDPCSVFSFDHSFCSKDIAILFFIFKTL